MPLHLSFLHSHKTDFIQINTHACQACWSCIDACPRQVLGKVEFFSHRHVRIDHAERCQGCEACIRACPEQAITSLCQ